MTKKRHENNAQDVIEALGDAVTRAIHHAPESLLRHFDTGRRGFACRRLSLRVVRQLAGDGWAGQHADLLDHAITIGIGRSGEGILASLSEARRCNGRLLDGIGLHIGERISEAMAEQGARLVRRWTAATPDQRT